MPNPGTLIYGGANEAKAKEAAQAYSPQGRAAGAAAAGAYATALGKSMGLGAPAPTVSPTPAGLPYSSPYDQQQQDFLNSLKAYAAGQGPSAATAMFNSGVGRLGALGQGVAASNPGLSPAAAARMSLLATGSAGADLLGQASQQRAQEQAQAMALYSNALGGARGQDIQRQLGNRGQDIQSQLGNRGLDVTTAGQNLNYQVGMKNANTNQANSNHAWYENLIGAGLTGAGALGGFLVGGPAGAAAGGYLGSQLGSYTGTDPNTGKNYQVNYTNDPNAGWGQQPMGPG